MPKDIPKPTTLYNEVIRISEEYLGPAAERFMRRQISTHTKKEPETLSRQDIPTLVNWSSIAFALLTSNAKDVEAFSQDLLALASNSPSR